MFLLLELSLKSAITVSGCRLEKNKTKGTLEYVVAILLACHLLVYDLGVVVVVACSVLDFVAGLPT